MPKKRTGTRGRYGGAGQDQNNVKDGSDVTLEQIKKDFLEIEALYTSTMKDLSREWDTPECREETLEQLREVEDLDEFYKLLDKIEIALSDPF